MAKKIKIEHGQQVTSHWQNGGVHGKLKLSAYLSATSPMRLPLCVMKYCLGMISKKLAPANTH